MRRFVIFGAAIAAVVLIWSAGWLYISNEIRTQVGLFAANDGYAAPRLTCGRLEIGGFPFRFNVTCSMVTVVAGDITLEVPRIEAASLVFQFGLYHARLTGPATVRDAYLGGQSRIDWDSLEGSLRLVDWRIGRLSLVGTNLAWSDTLVTETPIAHAASAALHLVDLPERHDEAQGRADLAGYLELDGAAIPAWTVADGNLTASVEITKVVDDVRLLPLEPVRDWQAAGGRIAITEIKAWEADDTITLTGDVGLNATGLAEGTIEIASKGIAERSAAFLAPEMQPLIFGIAGEDGLNRQRFTLANGVVFIGMLPAFGIPPLF